MKAVELFKKAIDKDLESNDSLIDLTEVKVCYNDVEFIISYEVNCDMEQVEVFEGHCVSVPTDVSASITELYCSDEEIDNLDLASNVAVMDYFNQSMAEILENY